MGPIKLWPLAVLAVAAWVGVLVAYAHLNQPEKPNNWNELCTLTPCEAFENTFTTVRMAAGDDYHLPRLKPNSYHGLFVRPDDKHFTERDAAGKLLRTAYIDAREFTITPCCRYIFDALGMPPENIAWDVTIGSNGVGEKFTKRRIEKLLASRPLESLPSWSAEFYLLDEGELIHIDNLNASSAALAARSNEIRRVQLLSKQPMFFDMHAYVDCRQSCDALTLKPMGAASYPPEVELRAVDGVAPLYCSETAEGCLPREQVVDRIRQKFESVQTMVELLRVHPTQHQPATQH